jgi:hypothetical protein
MSREYAGTNLTEIRERLREDGYTEVHEDRGEGGFDLWHPHDDLPSHACVHAVVWPREDGGFWVEEY